MAVKVAIIGSGNIGTDLMIKLVRTSRALELAALVGIDPRSEGLALAGRLGVPVTAEGIDGLDALWSALVTEAGEGRASAIVQLRLAGVEGARLAEKDRRDLRTALARVLSTDAESLPPAAALEGVLEGYQLAMLGNDDVEGVKEAFFRYWLTFVP